jgi:Flp pilus assembly protein TadD
MKASKRHRNPSLRLLLTAAWLLLAVATVLWFRPMFWRAKPPTATATATSDPFNNAQAFVAAKRPADALTAVNEALEAQPGNAGYLVFKGYRFVDLAQPDKAEATFRQAIALQPATAEATLGLAQALAAQAKRDEALSTLQALRTSDLTREQLHRRSRMYSTLSAFTLGLDDVMALLADAPADGALLDEASTLALASKDWNAAASLSERLVASSDDPVVKHRATSRRAMALRSAGRIGEAYADYRRASDPDNLEARAELALQLEDFGSAIDSYRALVAARPLEPRLRAQLAYALDRASRPREAEALYRELVQQADADAATRVRYAWLLNGSHRYAEAWQALAPLGRPSKDLQILDVQARTAAWAGEAKESVPLLRALLDIRPQDPELWMLLAESHRGLSDWPSRAEALRSYVRLNSQDRKARQDLADLLARVGSVGEAIVEYRALVAAEPESSSALGALGLLLESDGQLREAIPLYTRAVEASGDSSPDIWLRLARLYRWTSRPSESLVWYQRYVAGVADPSMRRPAESELALALFESGRAEASLAHIEILARDAPLEPGDLLTAARAETVLQRPARAVDYLDRLPATRPLDRAERVWLAGLLRSAGRTDRAVVLYDQLRHEPPADDVEVLEAAADLHADRGDPGEALKLYRGIPSPARRIALKIARAAAATGSRDTASHAYRDYLSANPQDVDAQLEAARFFARTNEPQLALSFYQSVVAARGADRLRVEIAHVELQGQHFQQAERWAREALAAGEDKSNATVALGQSLHLQGRSAEAQQVLRPLVEATRDRPEALPWLGHTAIARNRLLEGYLWFERALAANSDPASAVWLGRGEAARKRGDFARARGSYARALATGADPLVVGAAREILGASTPPRLESPVTMHADSNGLQAVEAGVSAATFLPGDRARVGAEVIDGEVRQHSFHSSRTVGSVFVDSLFPVTQLELQGALGQERYGAGNRAIGRAAGRYSFSDAAVIGLSVNRESLLSMHDSREPREFNRIIDLAGLGSDLGVSRLEGFLDLRDQNDRYLRGSGGEEWYEDGNRRSFLYVHYQVPVKADTTRWIVIRPNAYVETFRSSSRFYFSPRSHVTLGTMLHAVFTKPRWKLEAEVNPQILRTDGATGLGAHGLTSVTVRFGPVLVGGDAFVFYDDLVRYRNWRAGGRVSVPLRR